MAGFVCFCFLEAQFSVQTSCVWSFPKWCVCVCVSRWLGMWTPPCPGFWMNLGSTWPRRSWSWTSGLCSGWSVTVSSESSPVRLGVWCLCFICNLNEVFLLVLMDMERIVGKYGYFQTLFAVTIWESSLLYYLSSSIYLCYIRPSVHLSYVQPSLFNIHPFCFHPYPMYSPLFLSWQSVIFVWFIFKIWPL